MREYLVDCIISPTVTGPRHCSNSCEYIRICEKPQLPFERDKEKTYFAICTAFSWARATLGVDKRRKQHPYLRCAPCRNNEVGGAQ